MKILFGPDYPDKEFYSLALIIHQLGWTVTSDPSSDFDFAMVWSDQTWVEPPAFFPAVALSKPVLNLRCTDISKSRLEQVFEEVFGYGSFIDPTRDTGRCVEKSEENAVGGGRVVDCPLPRRELGRVYQRLIDSEQDGVQIEYRTPVILGEIPLVKVWHREPPRGPVHERRWLGTFPTETGRVFTDDECRRILELAARLGMDYGELDILRCKHSGRLYVIDANKTPSGYGMRNRVNWKPEDKRRSLARLAECLSRRVRALLGPGR